MSQYQEDCDDNLFKTLRDMLRSQFDQDKIGAMLAINRIVKIGRETRIVHNIKLIIDEVLK